MLDAKVLREAFGRFPTGVTVVTTLHEGEPVGFTANSFTSVSLKPPLLLVCPGKHLSSFDIFLKCERFAVNILAEGQETLATHFASFKGARFQGQNWQLSKTNVPWIGGATVQFSCKTHKVADAGDHIILIGKVVEFSQSPQRGLGFLSGQYLNLGLEAKAYQSSTREKWVGVIAEQAGAIYLVQGSKGLRPPCFHVAGALSKPEYLQKSLLSLGLGVEIDRVYSVFQSRDGRCDYTYFYARILENRVANGTLVPIPALADVQYQNSMLISMMLRFASEYQHRNFGLYLGDEDQGDLHHFKETKEISVRSQP